MWGGGSFKGFFGEVMGILGGVYRDSSKGL